MLYKTDLAKIEVARTLFHRPCQPGASIAVRITNLVSDPIGVALNSNPESGIHVTRLDRVGSPSGPAALATSGWVNTRPDGFTQRALIQDFHEHRLEILHRGDTLTYFSEVAHGDALDATRLEKGAWVARLAGLLGVTDGNRAERLEGTPGTSADAIGELALSLPRDLAVLPNDARIRRAPSTSIGYRDPELRRLRYPEDVSVRPISPGDAPITDVLPTPLTFRVEVVRPADQPGPDQPDRG